MRRTSIRVSKPCVLFDIGAAGYVKKVLHTYGSNQPKKVEALVRHRLTTPTGEGLRDRKN